MHWPSRVSCCAAIISEISRSLSATSPCNSLLLQTQWLNYIAQVITNCSVVSSKEIWGSDATASTICKNTTGGFRGRKAIRIRTKNGLSPNLMHKFLYTVNADREPYKPLWVSSGDNGGYKYLSK